MVERFLVDPLPRVRLTSDEKLFDQALEHIKTHGVKVPQASRFGLTRSVGYVTSWLNVPSLAIGLKHIHNPGERGDWAFNREMAVLNLNVYQVRKQLSQFLEPAED